jgi:hypothetical protein
MTDAEIADVKAGSYTGDVDSDLLGRLNQLEEGKAAEKARLDLFSGDVDERDQMLDNISLQNQAQTEGDAIRQRQLTGDTTFDTTPTNLTTDITSEQIDEFGTAPVTGVTRPGTELNPYNPNDRNSIIEKAQEAGVGNVEKHLENNSKLAQARNAGLISGEDYNMHLELDDDVTPEEYTGGSAFDATEVLWDLAGL